MSTKIIGKVFVLGDDVDTDQIIPAEHLSLNPADSEERRYFGMHALSGVPPRQSGLPEGNACFVEDGQFKSPYTIVVGGRNYGCGSSREHAPLAMAEAGIQAVVAEFFARIFYRNCVNGGYLLPCESVRRLVEHVHTGHECEIDLATSTFTNLTTGTGFELRPLGDAQPIIEAGGIFAYARKSGMLK